uniref:Frontoxin III n=1 Tax=Micrurus frontalis TaxID=129461 RepID=3S13_MICFR|nr:RecName: Full=Frontoxin III; Short=FTx III [Micrurus frontalis]
LTCFNDFSPTAHTVEDCQRGITTCYMKTWRVHRETVIERGCGCPKVKPGIRLKCCTGNTCNY